MFFIKDKSTGMTYDLNQQDSIIFLHEQNEKLFKLTVPASDKPWSEWWNKKKEQNSELLAASEKGNLKKVRDLLNKQKHGDLAADINAKGLDDYTALHYAVSEGHEEIVDLLLLTGANINAHTIEQRTPLHIAASRGNMKLIKKLCMMHADINAQDKDGNTPTHILSQHGHAEELEWMLKQGPNLNIKNAYEEIPSDLAGTVQAQRLFQNQVHDQPGYTRIVVENIVFHNNRADVVKNIMMRTMMIGDQIKKMQKTGESIKVVIPKVSLKKKRRKANKNN